jgi:CDP-diacylglycerol--glycerol-3-phosphate 3-phosphatidyltransferase
LRLTPSGHAPTSARRSPLDSLPNVLTCARIALVPVVAVVILTTPENWQVGAVVFALAAVTDALDGYIARARGCISTFGTMMDPVADKLLVGTALIALAVQGVVDPLVPLVVIAREVAVTGLRVHARRKSLEIPASQLGKAKMAMQVGQILSLMAIGTDAAWVQAFVYTTVGLTIASGLDYYAAYRRALRPAKPRAVPAVSSTEHL